MLHNMHNKNLIQSKTTKQDEYYTQLIDIENELKYYKEHFANKIVYCNCDKCTSNFVKYFKDNFDDLQLKELIYTAYDFRSDNAISNLKYADIVCTNPPFSLFISYVDQLINYSKKFLIIGNLNAISYKNIFRLIKDDKIRLGYNFLKEFATPNNDIKSVTARWYTNLPHKKRNEKLILTQKYEGNEKKYPKYDNHNIINVDKVKDIPIDYDGIMGVPISFIDKYNPEQFEIVGQMANTKIDSFNFGYPYINGKRKYARILIKNKIDTIG